MGSLNQEQESIIIGSLLGDGTLRLAEGKLNALFEVNHTIVQRSYVDWKYRHLQEFVKTAPKMRGGNGGRTAYRFTTQSLPIFTSFYQQFYQNKKKVIPQNLVITPLALAVWFMDDGSKSRSSVYLNTQQFSIEEQRQLLGLLQNQFKLIGALNKDKQYFRIRITTASTVQFKQIVRPYVIECFNYKLD